MMKSKDFEIKDDFLVKYKGNDSKVVIPSGVVKIGYNSFRNCKSITDIDIPEGVKCIAEYAFNGCVNLTSVFIPASVEQVDYDAFSGCVSLRSIKVSEGNTTFDSRDNCNAIIKTKTSNLILGCQSTIIPDGITRIGASSFKNCTGLKTISIPDSVKQIGMKAFYGCSSLTDIRIPDSVTNIGNSVFENCSSLKKSITIPGSVKKICDCAFVGCGISLVRYDGTSDNVIDWRQFDTSASHIGFKLFAPYLDFSKIPIVLRDSAILGFFENYEAENIPDSVKNSYAKFLNGHREKFYPYLKNNASMLNFFIDNRIIPFKDVESIADEIDNVELKAKLLDYKENAFSSKEKIKEKEKQTRLENSELEKLLGLRELTTADYRKMFQFHYVEDYATIVKYKAMEPNVTIPANIGKKAVKIIEAGAFKECNFMTSITIPESIIRIEKGAFGNNNNFTINCKENSCAHAYALNHKTSFKLTD